MRRQRRTFFAARRVLSTAEEKAKVRMTSPSSTLVCAVRATCSSAYVIFSWMKVSISSSSSSLASSCGVLALMWLTCRATTDPCSVPHTRISSCL